MKYRKKPIVIEAEKALYELDIKTLEGVMHANKGDWIITGVNGEKYPCKPDIFEKTYEPADAVRIDPRIQEIYDAIYLKWNDSEERDLSLEFVSIMLKDKFPNLSLVDGHEIKPFTDPRLKQAVEEIETMGRNCMKGDVRKDGLLLALYIFEKHFPELKEAKDE